MDFTVKRGKARRDRQVLRNVMLLTFDRTNVNCYYLRMCMWVSVDLRCIFYRNADRRIMHLLLLYMLPMSILIGRYIYLKILKWPVSLYVISCIFFFKKFLHKIVQSQGTFFLCITDTVAALYRITSGKFYGRACRKFCRSIWQFWNRGRHLMRVTFLNPYARCWKKCIDTEKAVA